MKDQDKWVNDPNVGVVKGSGYWETVEASVFDAWKSMGLTPEQASPKDEKARQAYAEYLKRN